jgi:DNA-binding MarR family transcriptional regulator
VNSTMHGDVKLPLRRLICKLTEFRIADLIHETGFNPNSIRTEINRLIKMGMVAVRPDPDVQPRIGRPVQLYFVTEYGKTILSADKLSDVPDQTNALYRFVLTAKLLEHFSQDEIAQTSGLARELCNILIQNLLDEKWLQRSSDEYFDVIKDDDGIIPWPAGLMGVDSALYAVDDYSLESEYYNKAVNLLLDLDAGTYTQKQSVVDAVKYYLDLSRKELGVSLGEKTVKAAWIDAAWARALIHAGQPALARNLGIRVLNVFLVNSLFEDSKSLVSALDEYTDLSNQVTSGLEENQPLFEPVLDVTNEFAFVQAEPQTSFAESVILNDKNIFGNVEILIKNANGDGYTVYKANSSKKQQKLLARGASRRLDRLINRRFNSPKQVGETVYINKPEVSIMRSAKDQASLRGKRVLGVVLVNDFTGKEVQPDHFANLVKKVLVTNETLTKSGKGRIKSGVKTKERITLTQNATIQTHARKSLSPYKQTGTMKISARSVKIRKLRRKTKTQD